MNYFWKYVFESKGIGKWKAIRLNAHQKTIMVFMLYLLRTMYCQKLGFMFRERGFRTENSCPLSARNICYWHSRSLTKNGKTSLTLHSHFRKRSLCVAWGWIKKKKEKKYEWRILWIAIRLTIYKCRLFFRKDAKNLLEILHSRKFLIIFLKNEFRIWCFVLIIKRLNLKNYCMS